jgi:ubiquitin conjugation factor E4 B
MLPEYLFENVAEYVEFLSRQVGLRNRELTARYNADALDDADKDILITFTIVFLSPGYVNNPFMKAKLVSVSLEECHRLRPGPVEWCHSARLLAQRTTV